MFLSNENKFWRWLLTSSADPTRASLTAKGIVLAIVRLVLDWAPALGIHLSPDFANLPDTIYGIVYWFLTALSAVLVVLGGLRKLWRTFVPSKPV